MGIKIKVKSGLKPEFAAILMGNHRSYADVLFILSGTPTVFLSKAEIKKMAHYISSSAGSGYRICPKKR
jgi:1-acyl-sn-glycerol-3-phosphate acyltransferase